MSLPSEFQPSPPLFTPSGFDPPFPWWGVVHIKTLPTYLPTLNFATHSCTIMLHQPHSQLDASPARAVNSCAPYRPVPVGDAFNNHTRHTITAACDISKMITYAVPLQHHTHFFTCVITMAAIVHLSKWAQYFITDEEDLREQIRLSIGALGKLSAIWKAAATAGSQVRGVAQEIYRAKKAQQIVSSAFFFFCGLFLSSKVARRSFLFVPSGELFRMVSLQVPNRDGDC